jgi:hypothetical protein
MRYTVSREYSCEFPQSIQQFYWDGRSYVMAPNIIIRRQANFMQVISVLSMIARSLNTKPEGRCSLTAETSISSADYSAEGTQLVDKKSDI